MRPYSSAFKTKVLNRLMREGISISQVAREHGLKQQTVSYWVEQARILPLVNPKTPKKSWSVEEKARIVIEAGPLDEEKRKAFLEREGVSPAELEQWRLALSEEGRAKAATTKRIQALERELVRKEQALAEAAALLLLQKKVQGLWEDEDDDTDGKKDK
jgi:transposase